MVELAGSILEHTTNTRNNIMFTFKLIRDGVTKIDTCVNFTAIAEGCDRFKEEVASEVIYDDREASRMNFDGLRQIIEVNYDGRKDDLNASFWYLYDGDQLYLTDSHGNTVYSFK